MKFAHIADCHLGGWQKPELQELNFKSFEYAIDTCLREKVEFILIAGDLFDSAYPSIEILKKTFNVFRKIKEHAIPVFLIAGSHDYSVSGKTFLDVLENAGFIKNVFSFEEKDGKIFLHPTIYKNVAIYGFPGKKSGLEVEEIEKIKLQDSPGLFKILMLHTTIKDAIPSLDIAAVDEKKLPKVDYLALGHLHINYVRNNRVYPGPIFPNNVPELEELKGGSFYIFNAGEILKREVKLKDCLVLNLEVKKTVNLAESIISYLETQEVKDKIVILKLSGVLEQGKIGDIDFTKIEDFLKKNKAYSFLKSTSKLHISESEINLTSLNTENLEEDVIKKFEDSTPNKFNTLIRPLIRALQIEKIEDESNSVFQERLISESKKIIENENKENKS